MKIYDIFYCDYCNKPIRAEWFKEYGLCEKCSRRLIQKVFRGYDKLRKKINEISELVKDIEDLLLYVIPDLEAKDEDNKG